MTGPSSLITAFTARPAVDNRGLLLEQQPWDPTTGLVTRLDLVQALSARLFDTTQATVDCGLDGSGFDATVFVYPYDPALVYEIGVTHGALDSPSRVDLEVREAVSFSLDTGQGLKYPLQQLIGWEWAGEVWSESGVVIPAPAVTVDGQEVKVAEKIYGTLYVRYRTLRYVYNLRIEARESSPENVFSSVVWARWSGGVRLLIIDRPKNAEENYQNSTDCRGGSIVIIEPGPDDPPPVADPVNRTITKNYCEDY